MCVGVVVFIRVLLKFESMSGSGEGLDLNVKVNIYYENYIGSIIKKQDTVHDFLIQFPFCFFRSPIVQNLCFFRSKTQLSCTIGDFSEIFDGRRILMYT